MYVCMYIYVYIYVYEYVYMCMYSYMYMYKHRTCELDVLILCTRLYLCVSNGRDLPLKHAGGSMFMHNL